MSHGFTTLATKGSAVGTSRIPLTQGLFALVDDEDYESIARYKWCGSFSHGGNKAIAVRGTYKDRKRRLVFMQAANKRYQPSRGGSSRFVGVTWDSNRCRWRAQIQVEGVVRNLGRFATEVDAARARDAYVITHQTGHELNLVPA